MAASFASQGDLGEKTVTVTELAPGAYAYTAEGDPNSGIILGDDGVMIVDAQATPRMAEDVIARVRALTDKPIRYLVLSHYHAVRTLGASAYRAEQVIASQATYEMICERGEEDHASERQRFPRLFRGADSIPGLTWPTMTFEGAMSVRLGRREVQVMQLGMGHTRGDIVVWLPAERVLFAGDLVEAAATPYCGDAQLREWPQTLERLAELKPVALVPGRGQALTSAAAAEEAIRATKGFVQSLYDGAALAVSRGEDLKACFERLHAELAPRYGRFAIFEHCMPFNAARAYDEASGIHHPRIWTAERDLEMWQALRG